MRPRPNSPRSWLSYALAIMSLALTAAAGAAPEVAVVLSEDTPAYREVAEALRAELARSPGPLVRVLPAAAADSLPQRDLAVVVAVGARAARAAAAERRVPVLSILVPRSTFERIAAEAGRAAEPRHFSALYLDQPLARQLDLIRLALPGASRVALLLGPESERLYGPAQAAAADRRLHLAALKIHDESELHPALQKLLAEAHALLALPDPAVFNSVTVSHILLTAYRQRVPVAGFSATYTRAGAVLALYSTPAQIGAQAAEMLRSALASGQLPPPQHPRRFTVSANAHVARSLGLALEDEATLARKLLQAETP